MSMRRIDPLGDSAVLVEFDGDPGTSLCGPVQGFCAAVKARAWPFVQDLVPALCSVCIHYDPLRLYGHGWMPSTWFAELEALECAPAAAAGARLHRLPICYEAGFGLDVDEVAQRLGLAVEALIQRHLAPVYQVAMIGFAPGFPYMEGLPAPLRLPRRATPRSQVPAGSVAITEDLCGIYPAPLPGGWHVLGRTPVRLFDVHRHSPSLLQAGDQVTFVRIDRRRFEAFGPC